MRLRRTLVGEGSVLVEPPEPPRILGEAEAEEEDPPIVVERWTVAGEMVGQLLTVKVEIEVGDRLTVVGDERSGLLPL